MTWGSFVAILFKGLGGWGRNLETASLKSYLGGGSMVFLPGFIISAGYDSKNRANTVTQKVLAQSLFKINHGRPVFCKTN